MPTPIHGPAQYRLTRVCPRIPEKPAIPDESLIISSGGKKNWINKHKATSPATPPLSSTNLPRSLAG